MLTVQCIILLFLGVLVLLASTLTIKTAEDLEAINEEMARLASWIRENEYKIDRLDSIVQITEQYKRRE